MLWLRLIEAATHTFSLRVYADSKLNYQVIYELCVSFDNEERRLDFCLKNHCERNSVITKTRLLEIFPGKKKFEIFLYSTHRKEFSILNETKKCIDFFYFVCANRRSARK